MRNFTTFFAGACLLMLSMSALTGPAQAQGIFDLSEISKGLSKGSETEPTGTTPPPSSTVKTATPSDITLDTFSYSASPAVRSKMLSKFITMLEGLSPDMAAQLDGIDLVELVGEELAKNGLNPNNIVDAYAAYMLTMYDITDGFTGDRTPAQLLGTRDMVFETMKSVDSFHSLSDANKQEAAEGLLLQAVLFAAVYEGVANDPVASANVQQEVRGAAKEMSLDIDLFQMTPNGLVRK